MGPRRPRRRRRTFSSLPRFLRHSIRTRCRPGPAAPSPLRAPHPGALASAAHPQEEACVAAQLAALQYGQGLLRFLHVIQQMELLDMNGEYVAAVAHLCNNCAVLAHAVLSGLAAQGGGSAQQLACVAGALQVLLGLAQQLTEAVRSCPAAAAAVTAAGPWAGTGVTPGHERGVKKPVGRRGGNRLSLGADGNDGDAKSDGDTAPLGDAAGRRQSLEAGQGEEAGALKLPPPDVALQMLQVSLVGLLCDAAVEPLFKGAVRVACTVLTCRARDALDIP